MHIHFYTDYDNLKSLLNDGQATVWTETAKSATDQHVSIDPEHHFIQPADKAKVSFYVSKKNKV